VRFCRLARLSSSCFSSTLFFTKNDINFFYETKSNIKILGYLGLLASVLVGIGEYLLHYSEEILGHGDNYGFFKFVPLENMSLGHFLAMIGLPLYFAGYLHLYLMLRSGNESLARVVLGVGFVAFAIGGVWIGSRASIGNIVHLEDQVDPNTYQNLIDHYTNHMEVLVQVLRIVIATVSLFFVLAILKGGTFYQKWMAFFNPILILILLVVIGMTIPFIGKHTLPILMNVTHFMLFTVSLIQLNKYIQTRKNG